MKKKGRNFLGETDGAVAPLMALCCMVFIGMASLTIDMGHLYAVKSQLQNTADAAALAAAGRLISSEDGVVVRNDAAAKEAALAVAQKQSDNAGLAHVEQRDDLSIVFGVWNTKAGSANQAWTERGETIPSDSDANAVQVTLSREVNKAYGPVTNLLAQIFSESLQTTEIKQVTAIAYMGYTSSLPTGMVTVPIALPDTLISVAESDKGGSWLFRLFRPKEAVATQYVETKFKDLGSDTFYLTKHDKPQINTAKAYLFVLNTSDSVPGTVINNLNFAKTGTVSSSSKPIRQINRGTQLYPLSEYQWVGNIDSIFAAFKNAYNTKKDAQGNWRVVVPVYSTSQPTAQAWRNKLFRLARIFSLGPSEAQACFTFWNQSYPGGNVPLYVDKFATVNISEVVTASTRTTTIPAPAGTCNDCTDSAIYDKKVNYQYIYSGSTTSERKADCMMKNTTDCRNTNYVTVEIPEGSSTTGLPTAQGGSSSVGSVAAAASGSFSGRAVLVK